MKTLEIGLPCAPGELISNEEIKTTEILVSWGGGMGGANKRYYATSKNGNEYTLIDGDKIKLNPNFIVHEKEVRLVKNITTNTNSNMNFTKKIRFIQLGVKQNWISIDRYDNNKISDKAIVHTEID